MFEDVSLHDPRGAYQSIFGLDVDEDFRHQGLAGRLMKALIEKAESEGRKGLILTCKEHLIGFMNSLDTAAWACRNRSMAEPCGTI